MRKRTTLEIDDELLTRAQRALGCSTMRATVEEALRRVAQHAENEARERAERQVGYLARLASRVDLDVLASEQMWR
ncbi:MAG: type II toxin-antitoxin system VapB family antitoxin [Egibacteraceae bacterium]